MLDEAQLRLGLFDGAVSAIGQPQHHASAIALGQAIAHLIDHCLQSTADSANGTPYARFVTALETAISQLRGTYGLAALFSEAPGVIFVARLGSPLVVGVGEADSASK